MRQDVAWFITLPVMLLVLAGFVWVARGASSPGSAEEITATAARLRTRIFWGLVLLFIPAVGYSLTKMPYPRATGDSAAVVVVQATGHQWAWELSPATVPVGKEIEIRVTGSDVNHGFGLYDPELRLLTQTQAMPGYTNVLRYTFVRPGAYRVICLEYCGLGHHSMMAPLTVTGTN